MLHSHAATGLTPDEFTGLTPDELLSLSHVATGLTSDELLCSNVVWPQDSHQMSCCVAMSCGHRTHIR